jgi:hypothetical protein
MKLRHDSTLFDHEGFYLIRLFNKVTHEAFDLVGTYHQLTKLRQDAQDPNTELLFRDAFRISNLDVVENLKNKPEGGQIG